MSELKPCPFCGSVFPHVTAVEIRDGDDIVRARAVRCWECGARSIALKNEDASRAAWNRRAVVAALDEPVAATTRPACSACGSTTRDRYAADDYTTLCRNPTDCLAEIDARNAAAPTPTAACLDEPAPLRVGDRVQRRDADGQFTGPIGTVIETGIVGVDWGSWFDDGVPLSDLRRLDAIPTVPGTPPTEPETT